MIERSPEHQRQGKERVLGVGRRGRRPPEMKKPGPRMGFLGPGSRFFQQRPDDLPATKPRCADISPPTRGGVNACEA